MQIPKILTNPNPILRKKASKIQESEIISKTTKDLVLIMKEVLKNSEDGVGLAAPQIGHSVQMFLVSEEALAIDKGENTETEKEKTKPDWKYLVFINPVIKKFSAKKVSMAEGCLSVPGVYGAVKRPEKIEVEWLDEHGKKHSRGCSKFFARVIQHEYDHINGILFIDKMHEELKIEKGSSRL